MKKVTKSHVGWLAFMAALAAGCNSNGGDTSTTNNSGSSCTPVTTASPAVAKIQLNADELYLNASSSGAETSNASGGTVLKKLHGHIPNKVKDFSDQGKVSEEQIMPLTVALELNNESDLEANLAQMYQVGSPTYHQFLTPAQFRAQYAPTAQQLAQVSSLLQAQGMTGVQVSDNKLYVKASGAVSAINSFFHTEIHQYQDAQSKQYFAPAYELQVPMESGIKAVVGLQNVTQARKHSVRAEQSHSSGSGPSGGLSPSDVRTAYSVPSSVTGATQTLALFELDGYTASDIAGYEKQFSLPSVPLQNVLVDGATGAAGGGADEVTLDIELMTAIAPGVSKILVYEGPNDEASILDVYSKIASDNLAQSVSSSWGSSEDSMSTSSIQAEDTVFKQMAAQGQSFYSAAGDSGADDNGSSLSVDDPSSQPYVVGVGGTSLTIGSGGAYQSETTWNDESSGGGAGGGGVSSVWTIPAWQVGAATGNTLGSSTMRNVPDVSLEADPNNGYSIYLDGSWAVFGGTSCAAPIWAAYTALLNQQRVANGQSVIGFPNALLYQTGKGARYGDDFHDIANGSTNGHYPAVSGYDDATGWGSFNGTNLFDDLSNDTAISVNNPINSCGT